MIEITGVLFTSIVSRKLFGPVDSYALKLYRDICNHVEGKTYYFDVFMGKNVVAAYRWVVGTPPALIDASPDGDVHAADAYEKDIGENYVMHYVSPVFLSPVPCGDLNVFVADITREFIKRAANEGLPPVFVFNYGSDEEDYFWVDLDSRVPVLPADVDQWPEDRYRPSLLNS